MQQPRISNAKAAAIGAALGVIAVIVSHALGNKPTTNNAVAYWFGVALGGALFGVAIAAFKNRGR